MTMMQASDVVRVELLHQGLADFTFYNTGGGCMVTAIQVDLTVYVVGQDDYTIGVYSVADWLDGENHENARMVVLANALEAAMFLRRLTFGANLYHCGACNEPIWTAHRYHDGRTRCGWCDDGGVDHAFHHRHVGSD